MGKPQKSASDFRYCTGESKVPWAAVGEPVRAEDIAQMVSFLVRPGKGEKQAYERQLRKVTAEIEKLKDLGNYAGKLTLGNQVSALEEQVTRFLGTDYASFLTNCTAGFEIVYKYAGLKAGDEVIAPAITFIATIAYPLAIGAKVVLADVDPRTLNMDPADVKRKVTDKTKMIVPVHLGGYPVDMDPIMKLARERDITVLEDAAHAFGASYKGKMCGALGHFGAFSFHEVKNVTSLGEGGILTTKLPFGQYFNRARFLGLDFSKPLPTWPFYDVPALPGKDGGVFVAGNHSATEIQALALSMQMGRLKQIIAKRRKAAEYLNRRFSKVEGIIPQLLDDERVKSSYHLYLLQIDPAKVGADVQALKKKLAERGLVQIQHFAPLYKLKVMQQMGYDTAAIQASCPVAEEAFTRRFTHLPLYDYTQEQLQYMADNVIEAVKELKAGK